MTTAEDKHNRMTLRRAIGNREVRGPSVRPYFRGPDYLIAHACFDCRKSWKLPGDCEHSCPECRKPLALMGRTFKVPKKSERDQWEKVARLWRAGFQFWSYDSYPEAEPYPDDLRDVDDFIRRNAAHPMRINTRTE